MCRFSSAFKRSDFSRDQHFSSAFKRTASAVLQTTNIFQVVESQRFSKVMLSAAQDCRKDFSRIHVSKYTNSSVVHDARSQLVPSDILVHEVRFFKRSNLYEIFQHLGLVSKHDGFRDLWVRKRGSTEVRWSWIGGQQVDGIKASTLAAPAQAAIGGDSLGSTSKSLVCCCRLSLSGSGSPTGGDGDDDDGDGRRWR